MVNERDEDPLFIKGSSPRKMSTDKPFVRAIHKTSLNKIKKIVPIKKHTVHNVPPTQLLPATTIITNQGVIPSPFTPSPFIELELDEHEQTIPAGTQFVRATIK